MGSVGMGGGKGGEWCEGKRRGGERGVKPIGDRQLKKRRGRQAGSKGPYGKKAGGGGEEGTKRLKVTSSTIRKRRALSRGRILQDIFGTKRRLKGQNGKRKCLGIEPDQRGQPESVGDG